MPKKKGKKKSGKKGKKDKKDEMTPTEALIAYQLNIKERDLEELKFLLKSEEEKKARNIERNERLVEERRLYMEKMLEKVKHMDASRTTNWSRGHVVFEMKENWRINKEEHAGLVEIHKQIKLVEKAIQRTNSDILYWRSYRDNELVKQAAQIKILNQQLEEMNESYESIASYLDKRFAREKGEIEAKTTEAIHRQKDIAADKAVKILDTHSKQEVLDHEWLKKEERVHSAEVRGTLLEVEALERENLSILSELFQCTVEDLQVSKNIFLTQVNDYENLDTSNVVGIDLTHVFQEQLKLSSRSRPKSAIHQAVEDKYKEVLSKASFNRDEEVEVSEESVSSGEEGEADDNDDDDFQPDSFSNGEGSVNWQEYMDVGPLELKMLCVTGESVRLRTPYRKSTEEEVAELWNPTVWPVTQQMLSATLVENEKK